MSWPAPIGQHEIEQPHKVVEMRLEVMHAAYKQITTFSYVYRYQGMGEVNPHCCPEFLSNTKNGTNSVHSISGVALM